MGEAQARGERLWGEGRPEAKVQHPLPPSPHAGVCCCVVTWLLTSASFQSPGMQKDSSRSLPHSSKIRSSEEGDTFAKGVSEDLGSCSSCVLPPDAPRSRPHLGLRHPCTSAWACAAQKPLPASPQAPCRPHCLRGEGLLLQGASGLPGTEGFLGMGVFPC